MIGATATGKSELGIRLALELDGEVVNFDSRQVYRGLAIGTSQVLPQEQRGVPHHGFDVLDPAETTTAGRFLDFALPTIHQIWSRSHLPILVGGTGLYLEALKRGLSPLPRSSPGLRSWLQGRPTDELRHWMTVLDEPRSRELPAADRPRAIRAVEVALLGGVPMSERLGHRKPPIAARWILVGCRAGRDALVRRIAERVDRMWSDGFVEEVQSRLESGVRIEAPGFSAIGYREVARFIEGEIGDEECRTLIARATGRYARRQVAWFRREKDVEWFDLMEGEPSFEAVVQCVQRKLREEPSE